MPRPDRAPRETWDTEIRNGYQRYRETGRQDLTVPPVSQVAAYFREHAPPWTEWRPPSCAPPDRSGLHFTHTDFVAPGGRRDPFLAGLAVLRADDELRGTRFVFADMRSGQVVATGPRLLSEICQPLGSPCHLEPCDLDQDGRIDLVVADLGAFSAGDHHRGKVVWLRARAEGGYQRIDLATGLGRVADARPGDFDGDGDLDLVVAEFGFERTGRVVLLENRAIGDDSADFALHLVDSRHGTIHVPVTDLNHDGHLDFVALISQEYEVVEAFLGRGDLSFDRQTIFAAEDPSYASSGIELVDLDADNDLDVLYVNGDCFDGAYMKPYHAVQWLENTGGYPYEHHLLAHMPGASRAVAGDLDGDGDLDVVAASMLVPKMLSDHGADNFDSLVWFEQTTPRRFERHGLEKATCDHFGLELGDFDADGDLDMAVGNAIFERRPAGQEPPALTIWWNQRNSSSYKDEGKKMEGRKIGREREGK
ncbi:MAG TPA: VCBS repeat-containing protein [Pirellulales bacterium]|nr:VCBS repeat-containing protein [Pirellulales bacterium]